MDSLYTPELRQFVQTRDWPVGLNWSVHEYYISEGEPEDCLRIHLYRDNINALSGDEKLHLASVLNSMLTSIQKTGIPFYTRVVPGYGP